MNMQPTTSDSAGMLLNARFEATSSTTTKQLNHPVRPNNNNGNNNSLCFGGNSVIYDVSGATSRNDFSVANAKGNNNNNNQQEIRKSLSLDFANAPAVPKKVLQTPELIRSLFEGCLTPSQSNALTPTPVTFLCPKNVTAEQESYVRGFEDALTKKYQEENGCLPSSSMLSSEFVDSQSLDKSGESGLPLEPILYVLKSSSSNATVNESTISTTCSSLFSSDAALPHNVYSASHLQQNHHHRPLSVHLSDAFLKQETYLSSPENSPRCGSNLSSCSATSTSSSSGSSYSYRPNGGSSCFTTSNNNNSQMNFLPQLRNTSGATANQQLIVPGNMLPVGAHETTAFPSSGNPMGNGTANQQHHHAMAARVKSESVNHNHQGGGGGFMSMISPMDPRSQEKLKLDRKRARNRLAATKCRRRKIERIELLQNKVDEVACQNEKIDGQIYVCKQQIQHLKNLLKEHQHRGCQVGNLDIKKRNGHN